MQPFLYQFTDTQYLLIQAGQTLIMGILVALLIYVFIEWIFRITGVEHLSHKFLGNATRIGKDPLPKAFGKYLAIFVFLLFLRNAVEKAGYREIEEFLTQVVNYLPHLLLALLISFFGLQSSRTAYSIVYNAFHFENPRTAIVLGHIARVVIIFFSFTIVLNQINTGNVQIIPEYLIRSILIGFVAATSLAFGLAFGLGGRESAGQMIQEYMNKKNSDEKNLKK